jgi:hypothetical protein
LNDPYHAALLNNEQAPRTITGVRQVERLPKVVGG